jgi:density-regulated protein DRP1
MSDTIYCGICTLPVEFCEFGKTLKKCKAWLEESNIEKFNKLYNSDEINKSSLSSEREAQISSSLAKMQLKEERKQVREAENLKNSKILIKRIPRTKHKHIVAISNLEILGNDIDLKKIAKIFASKFATGSSVSKNAEKKDEIVIQGDVANEVEEYLTNLMKEKGIDIKIDHVTERFTNKKK